MDGKQLQVASDGVRPDNVDVLYGFPLGGAKVDLAIAACRSPKALGLKFWRIDAAGARPLTDVTDAA